MTEPSSLEQLTEQIIEEAIAVHHTLNGAIQRIHGFMISDSRLVTGPRIDRFSERLQFLPFLLFDPSTDHGVNVWTLTLV